MAGSLEFIKSANTTSNVSLISATNCFSDKYDVYKVIYKVNEVGVELATETRLIDSGGSVITDAEYDYAVRFMTSTSAFSEGRATSATNWRYTMYNEGSVGGFFVMYIFNPYDSSSYTFQTHQMASHYLASSTSTLMARKAIGVHKVAEQITGIQVYAASANITNATLSVYGVK